jgi:hypothetical protein
MRAALDAPLHARSLDRELAVGIAAWRSPAHELARALRRIEQWLNTSD